MVECVLAHVPLPAIVGLVWFKAAAAVFWQACHLNVHLY